MTRRPLASRQSFLARAAARSLARKDISPNTISKSSLVFAAAAGLSFCLSTNYTIGYLFAALFIQARLLANLFDGMVAVEHDQHQADGGFWNEFPDRPADVLILTGMGIAAGSLTLGLLASIGALLTAYTRSLGDTLTPGISYFQGPMAKQHRMFAATLGALAMLFLPYTWPLWLATWVIIIGTIITILYRSHHILKTLKGQA